MKKEDKTFEHKTSDDNFLRFSHEAMMAIFEIVIEHDDKAVAASAAREAFEAIDKLEARFSRFISNSEISALNSLPANTSMYVCPDTFAVLEAAKKYHARTDGLFDITMGVLFKCWFDKDRKLRTPTEPELAVARSKVGVKHIKLDDEDYSVSLAVDNMTLDLGGIGKGYAIDKAVEILKEWGIKKAMVIGGFSSIYALGKPTGEKGWLVSCSDPADKTKVLSYISLADQSLSSSGLARGRHIIDPRNGTPILSDKVSAWVISDNATGGDCLSTAIMLMNAKELQAFLQKFPELQVMQTSVTEKDGKKIYKYERFGDGFTKE
ncbi:MAG: FAD:protein FMN transferase [Phycisphaerae bacterium]|nr:FAD:protein FMN transferase [Phycisphaerae bacterium]